MTDTREKKITITTYNKSALQHTTKFNEIGPRVEDIKKTFSYINKNNPKTIELGCGNGRDAKEIIKYTNDYLGIDLSEELIKIAKKYVPDANFLVDDIESYEYPNNIDVVFAFASLLHCDKLSVKNILNEIYNSMNLKGVFFISTKYGKYHKETVDREGFGTKVYYYYTQEDIKNILPEGFNIIFQDEQEFREQKWLTLILQKVE